jgi:Tfp pilus assembly PilM family ATPase
MKLSDTMLAIDLAPDALRILDVTFRRGEPQVTAIASGTLAPGDLSTLPERHLAALASLMQTHRIRARECVAAVPTSLVVTRSVAIDPSKPQTPEEQIRVILQNCVSYDPRDLVFDFWPVSDRPDASRTQEVLVVAAQGSVVQRYLDGFMKLKLSCVHLDVAPCAVATLISRLLPNAGAMAGVVALTGSTGYFAVVERNRVLFCRPFDVPARAGLQAGMGRIGDEISKCISHMVGTLHLDGMTEILAFGDGTSEDSFAEYLVNRFNMQVRAPSPFDSLPPAAVTQLSALVPADATRYATVLGLALQNSGGPTHG